MVGPVPIATSLHLVRLAKTAVATVKHRTATELMVAIAHAVEVGPEPTVKILLCAARRGTVPDMAPLQGWFLMAAIVSAILVTRVTGVQFHLHATQ